MSNPIRILCVFGSLNRGGSETMCMNLYRNIDRTTVQFDFVKHCGEIGAYEEEIISLGGKIYQAPSYKIYNEILYKKWWKNHLSDHPEHQIIHGHYFTISKVYFDVCKKMNRITIAHSHCTAQIGKGLKLFLKKQLQKNISLVSDYRFACSKDAGEWLFPNSEFSVLKNAIDTNNFVYDAKVREAKRTELLNDNNCLFVGTVGRLTEQKNPSFIIDICKSLKKISEKESVKVKFVWIGVGEKLDFILSELQRNNLQDMVMMLGSRSDVNEILQAIDVFVLPSLWEGLGIVAVEAQAAGLPTLCSDAVPKEAKVTDLCEFLPLGDPRIWADKIFQNKDVVRRDTQAEVVNAGYDIKSTAKWLTSFYLEIGG